MRARPVCAAAVICGALLLPRAARSQETVGNIALNQLDPAPAGDVFVGVPSPFTNGHLQPRVRALFDHAIRPLVLSTDKESGDVVSRQTLLHIDAAMALWNRLVIDLAVPVVLAQGGEDPTLNDVAVESPSSASMGDMRLGVRVRPFGDDGAPIQLAFGAYAYAPTGSDGAYAGDGGFRVSPLGILGGRIGKVVWSMDFGGTFTTSDNPSTIRYGVGMGILLLEDFLQIGPEIYGATPLKSGFIPISSTEKIERAGTTNMELMLSARMRFFWGLTVSAALGPGLTDAIGTPSFRLVGGVGWTMPPKTPGVEGAAMPADTDKDGIIDAADACPHTFGVASDDPKRKGCPVLDSDEDGVLDEDDACPDNQGPKDADRKKNGCPVDGDGDGITDDRDACPAEKGEASTEASKNGCAPLSPVVLDADSDGVPDDKDACPQEKGAERSDAASTGCPALVRVKGNEITLLQPIAFKTKAGKDTLDPDSEAALKEVVEVINQHPEYSKIEVQGYTDNVGAVKLNEKVSGARAELVRAWLAEHGIAADRLVARGYGPASPIADNKTADGRKANRRVQIVVIETKKP